MAKVLNAHLQDCILYMLITNTDFLKQTKGVFLSSYFSSSLTEDLGQLCISYFDIHKEAPKDHFGDEFHRFLARRKIPEEERQFYFDYVKKVQGLSSQSLNADYVLSCIDLFARTRVRQAASIEFAKLIERGEVEKADLVMYEALKSGIHSLNIGLDYLHDFRNLANRGQVPEYLLKTGIQYTDWRIGGLNRGEFICIAGEYKGGKSWNLIHLGKQAMLAGLNTLHISHENSEIETEIRYDMAYGAMYHPGVSPDLKRSKGRQRITVLKDGEWVDENVSHPSVFDTLAVRKVRGKVARLGGRLIIKKYPMGTCSMDELYRYLDYLETHENFIPDVLINDYADIMRLSEDELRHGLNKIYIAHKGLADERSMLVVTVSQVVVKGRHNRRIAGRDLSEDARKWGNIDKGFAINQSEAQHGEGIAEIHIFANRSGYQGGRCIIGQSLSTGQFCLWSKEIEKK